MVKGSKMVGKVPSDNDDKKLGWKILLSDNTVILNTQKSQLKCTFRYAITGINHNNKQYWKMLTKSWNINRFQINQK